MALRCGCRVDPELKHERFDAERCPGCDVALTMHRWQQWPAGSCSCCGTRWVLVGGHVVAYEQV